jgi:hypothetical protein
VSFNKIGNSIAMIVNLSRMKKINKKVKITMAVLPARGKILES